MGEHNPEIGAALSTGGYLTNYHDVGSGEPVVLLHGSGAGVSGWANWRGTLPVMAGRFRAIAPDLVGFGYTERPVGITYRFMDTWIEQMVTLLDGLGIEAAHFVGNSFGGAVTLAMLARHPERVKRAVLMGSGGSPFAMPAELEVLWGAQPSVENMKRLIEVMVFDQGLVTEELAEVRYRAMMRPGVREAMGQLFPPPRQRWLDAQCRTVTELRDIENEVMVIHGREDRVVPLHASLDLFRYLRHAQLHVFGGCGHWTQIEHGDRFNRLVMDFLTNG